jgi:chromosome segregation ATPase
MGISDNKESWKKLKALNRAEWDRLCADSKNRYISVARKLIARGSVDHIKRLNITEREIAEIKTEVFLKRDQERQHRLEREYPESSLLRNEINSLKREVDDLNGEIKRLTKEHDEESDKLREQLVHIRDENAHLREKLFSSEERISQFQDQIIVLKGISQKRSIQSQEEIIMFKDQIIHLQEDLATSQERIEQFQDEAEASRARITYLENLLHKCTACESMSSVREEFISFIKTQSRSS